MIFFKILILLAFTGLLTSACSKDPVDNPKPPDVTNPIAFAKGADVSWVTDMESKGILFYNNEGVQMECMALMKSLGMNAIRLRVWVNPTEGWNNKADVLVKAKRAKELGMRLLINFHYSDYWADPGKQTKPSAWKDLPFADLQSAVSNHTTEILTALKNLNITPEWVQVGNETGNGMLWEEGKASVHMANYASLSNAGYEAVKAVFPYAKMIVHLHNGWDNNLYRWLFDGLENNNGQWDVIGMSLYPTKDNWKMLNDQCIANVRDMIQRYGKEVMITEVGMPWDQAPTAKLFLTDLITRARELEDNKCLGVFYWEPQAYNGWKGYTLGAFDRSGKPTEALDAFKE